MTNPMPMTFKVQGIIEFFVVQQRTRLTDEMRERGSERGLFEAFFLW